ncbi:MAG: glycogen synthase GlgA [Planctomycetota bacterium]
MRVVLASSEAVPFAKSGGLADVSTALAKAVAGRGHAVHLVMPYYASLMASHPTEVIDGLTLRIPVGTETYEGRVRWTSLPADRGGADVTVLFVEQPVLFSREGLYGDADGDFGDNCARFAFFSRAVLETCKALLLRPDVVHANDWQTGLIPVLLAAEYGLDPTFVGTGSVFTIHNLAYQGGFSHEHMLQTGLGWEYFNWRQMEHFGGLNLLKTGIVFADRVNTVSPSYAWEITTAEGGCGLDGTLAERGADLSGILNGIDLGVWNPATDPHIATNYDASDWAAGKAACKAALRQELGLPTPDAAEVPLFGMISRMADQKGFDILAEAADEIFAEDLQCVFLGTGDPRYESLVRELSAKYPDKVAAFVGFDEGLAHRIEAGCDAFLMPSRYEPCGLNQMYSMAYGTVPVVRAVGGLKDTVVDLDEDAAAATGLSFVGYDAESLTQAVQRTVDAFGNKPVWSKLVANGMARDFSWDRSAAEYLKLYEAACGPAETPQIDEDAA